MAKGVKIMNQLIINERTSPVFQCVCFFTNENKGNNQFFMNYEGIKMSGEERSLPNGWETSCFIKNKSDKNRKVEFLFILPAANEKEGCSYISPIDQSITSFAGEKIEWLASEISGVGEIHPYLIEQKQIMRNYDRLFSLKYPYVPILAGEHVRLFRLRTELPPSAATEVFFWRLMESEEKNAKSIIRRAKNRLAFTKKK